MGQRETSNHLPREIIEEILYVLPVKTLLRFKCVSKSWRSLISSKEFIKEHLKRSNKDVEFPHCKLKLSSNQSQKSVEFRSLIRNNQNRLNPCHLRSLLDNPIITSSDNHLGDSFYMAQIVGSCHGLILMTISWRYLCLWNPCTRKIRKVVPPSAYFPQGQQFVYGLGYDEYTDDYKIVCIHIPYMNNYQTEMYSSKSDSWKKIENFDKGLPVCDFGNLVNGRLHWMAMSDGGDLVIVSLDLVEEKYGIVAYPENYVNPSPLQPILKNLGGYLCLITRSTSARDNMDVWVMLKYGERESWTKVWTLSGIHDPMMKLIGDYGPDFVVYNQKKRLLCYKSRFDMLDATNMKSSIFYVESLVSPFGDEELCL